MSVYPFYVEVDSSTRKSTVGVGCKSKQGEMTVEVYQRNEGSITNPYTIRQYTLTNEENGTIRCVTSVSFQGKEIHSHFTDY